MQTPLVLDAALQLAAQAPGLRLSGPAWEALLASLGTAPPPPGAPPSGGAQLSPTAQLFAQVLKRSVHESPPALGLRVEMAAGQTHPQQVAAALADAVSGSGMFYESHLAEWVQGSRNTAALLAESQMRAATETATGGTATFQQQVAALATGNMAFFFSAWPGQRVELAVSGDAGPDPQHDPGGPSFVAQLEMDLPVLGAVRAMLSLRPQGIDVELRASAPPTAQALEDNRSSLAGVLAAAGLQVGRIEVEIAP